MSKILITGASGFIGSNLVEYLIKDKKPDENLRLLVPPWENLQNLPKGVFEIAIADVRNETEVERAAEGVDVIYHLAAKTIIPNGSYDYYKDTNVDGTRNLLAAARKHRVKKFIFFSSISVYGLPEWVGDIEGCDEEWPKNFSEAYGHTKAEAEKILLEANKNWGLNYIIIRPTTVYGPKDKAGIFQLLKAINLGVFFFIGNAKNKMDYVYVEDLVRAARISEKEEIVNEDFIIGAGKPTTQRDLVRIAASVLGKSVSKIYVPKLLALFMAYFIQGISNILHIRPLLFPDRVKVLTSNCYFDISKAKGMLKYTPKYDLNKGIKQTVRWFMNKDYGLSK